MRRGRDESGFFQPRSSPPRAGLAADATAPGSGRASRSFSSRPQGAPPSARPSREVADHLARARHRRRGGRRRDSTPAPETRREYPRPPRPDRLEPRRSPCARDEARAVREPGRLGIHRSCRSVAAIGAAAHRPSGLACYTGLRLTIMRRSDARLSGAEGESLRPHRDAPPSPGNAVRLPRAVRHGHTGMETAIGHLHVPQAFIPLFPSRRRRGPRAPGTPLTWVMVGDPRRSEWFYFETRADVPTAAIHIEFATGTHLDGRIPWPGRWAAGACSMSSTAREGFLHVERDDELFLVNLERVTSIT